MTVKTRSAFNYGHVIDSSNYQLNFNEGGPELTAELNVSSYSLGGFATKIERSLNAAGGQTYTVTVDRTVTNNRKLTISASSNFSLLISSGSNSSTSAFSLAGYTGADLGPGLSFTSDTPSGSEFRPQFLLQEFVDFEDDQSAVNSTVNEASSGVVETVSYGLAKRMTYNIVNQTELTQGDNNYIENNPTGVSDLRDFMVAITKKSTIEFIPDRNNPSVVTECYLERTPESGNGTAFRLKEQYNRTLADYFDTGALVFRKV